MSHPKHLHWFPVAAGALLLGACSTLDRSLVFATHTTTGLEVSAQGTSSTPLCLVIGQKRFEGVLNPVYDEEGIGADGSDKYRSEAYSVIAKFEGNIEAGAQAAAGTGPEAEVTGAVSSAQWFATGQAAKSLAEHLATAAVLTDNPAVAKELSTMSGVRLPTSKSGHAFGVSQMRILYAHLNHADTGPEANKLATRLDTLRTEVPATYPFDLHGAFTAASAQLALQPGATRGASTGGPAADFNAVLSFYDRIQTSLNGLEAARDHATANSVQIAIQSAPVQTVGTGTLEALIAEHQAYLDDYRKRTLGTDEARAAVQHLSNELLGTPGGN